MDLDRLLDLQEKAAAGALSPEEAKELDSMTASENGKATPAQLDYIEMLLDHAEADVEDYTNVALDDLTIEEASELIDQLKDDLGYD